MADFSSMTDEELLALKPQFEKGPPQSEKSFADMTDEELLSLKPQFEKATPEQKKPPVEQTNTFEDVAKSAGAGLARGAMDLIGLPGTIKDGVQWAGNKLIDAVIPDSILPPLTDEQYEQHFKSNISGEAIRGKVSELTDGATEYKGKTLPGQYVGTASEFIPGAAAFGGLSPANLTKFGLLPGMLSEAAGQATKDSWAEPYARMAAAILSPAAPALLKRAVTPSPIKQGEHLRQADVLEAEGIPLSGGQKTDNIAMRYAEGELGGTLGQEFMETQKTAFTKAALKRIGEDAERASPNVMNRAYKRIGGQFDDLAARNDVAADKTLVQDLLDTRDSYFEDVAKSNRAPFVDKIIKDIAEELKTKNSISGKFYQNVRSKLGKKVRNGQSEGEAAANIQHALDDAMERGLVAANSPDVGAWKNVRELYRNFLVIEKAAAGAGQDTARGLLSPSQLLNATKSKQGIRNYVTGKGDFADLARAGEGVLKELPNSGTAARVASKAVPAILGGSTAGLLTGGLEAATVAGTMVGSAVPGLMGRAMLSRPGRKYLGNQLMSNPPVNSLGGYSSLPSGILAGEPIQ